MKKIIIAITTIITFLLVTTCDEPNKPDKTPPTVEVTYPISGSTISGLIVVTATTDDNVGVEKVEFYIDGQKKITKYQEPWQYEWDTEDYANGEQHSIYAKAYDEAENTSSSSVILVTIPELHYLLVSNDSLFYNDDQTSLTFDITNSGTGTLTWTISDDMTWLSVTPTTGNTTTESDQITATVDRTGLSPGNYSGTITVTPNNGNPGDVGITMTVLTYCYLVGYTYYSGTTIPVSGVSVNIDDEYYTTGTDGYFILNNIAIGNVLLTATKDGYDQYQTTVTINEDDNSLNIPMTSAQYTHNLYGYITDDDQQSLSGVTVTVLNDDSTDSQLQTISDAGGYYQVPTVPQGQRRIKFQKPNYEPFIAQIFMSNSDYQYNSQLLSLYGTVTDIDGNTYQTLLIGNQKWMIENLKVTHYRNGDAIQYVQSESSEPNVWENLSTGAYGYYNDDQSHQSTYGNLYNWYAVDDNRNIAPEGWHVPTDDEWQTLVDYLGGSSVAGGKLKEAGTTHWNSPNSGATNESGFTALPGGYRSSRNGSYSSLGYSGYFWSSSEYYNYYAWYRILNYNNSDVNRYNGNKDYGRSIRCIRD
ncbi:MAG: carboxypeptidase regulatory-like domain-containing protein [Candidatus Marinimicrobia bacterium]|nr:carboxypeptidase regulatory-like domain-containing protein [Candidatus Neomarinimicrobiota bacterium]